MIALFKNPDCLIWTHNNTAHAQGTLFMVYPYYTIHAFQSPGVTNTLAFPALSASNYCYKACLNHSKAIYAYRYR